MASHPEEPCNQFKIQPTDVVSGWLYLKLIADYQEYDKRQKEYILSLENRISEMMEILENTRSGTKKTLSEKLERRKKTIREQGEKLRKLKTENEDLLCKLTMQKIRNKSNSNE